MRRFLLLLLFALTFPKIILAQESWVIESFHSEISIPQNGKVKVVEEIKVDFGALQKHGIFRDIPTQEIKFRLLSVLQDGAKAIKSTSATSDGVSIRIGDADETISGEHTYKISYEVGKVITRFSDHDEFYWDVTGNDWGVSINQASATVTLEGDLIGQVTCYTGAFGSSAQNCTAGVEQGVASFSASSLSSGEGLTIVNSLPKGLVQDPIYWGEILTLVWVILGSLVAVIYASYNWWKHGRDMWYRGHVIDDPHAQEGIKPLFARQTVVPEFESPRGLRPAEIGTLVDEHVDMRDISASIVDLAVRGYIKITEQKDGRKAVYAFDKLKDFEADKKLAEYEKEILRGIFGGKNSVELSDLEDKFYTHLKKIKEELYAKLVRDGFFAQSPDKVWGKIVIKILALGAIAFGLNFIFGFLVAIPPVVLGMLLLLTGRFMPRKTALGTEMVRRSAGLKLFVGTAQKYMQQFNERINRFDEFLPYAMVFGVVGKWVGTFKQLGIEPPAPGWYVGYSPFNALNFSSSMNNIESAFASTLPSSPSQGGGSGFSSGGGFSGGGFGGGGGGSW